ncbi:uncharacterized protein GGS22DRAFT_171608 [Annulohypoxylon maeteangense]|uniref:uncharacterized protein n=1 Tax=Annulohypoxylon maeteangense TaxID=1927788 RepID=UPI002008824B|nr:uncharacterized protein GGS22DRAFT_171608 [Annulohypoxylon maeteangense]KAI0881687.1 hypothetical protein GGS22DRAFT_171608 [Annulohypoxylon maeteangense]
MAGPAVKQQRLKTTLTKAKTPSTKQHASSNLSSFTRVSKTPTTKTDVKKENVLSSTPKKSNTIEALTPASRKRKIVPSVEEDLADETPTKKSRPAIKSAKVVTPAKPSRSRPSKEVRPKPTPRKRVRSPSVSDSDESAINAGALFKRLRLESSPSRCSSPLTADTPITVYSDFDEDCDPTTSKADQLPDEVLALLDLHSALLKTLTLHYAHNGYRVPADLRVLCPNVARAWGKKKVTDGDIRICLGVLTLSSQSNPLFTLSNYGRGKICIEIDAKQQRGGRPLEEDKLNNVFRENLVGLWSQYTATSQTDSSAFSSTLPKAPVTVCESVAKAAPVLAKGQKRLEELKFGIAQKKQEKENKAQKKPTQPSADTPMTNADGSKMSLLDRIRLKSLQKAALPAGLSQAEIERRAALQRASEVAACLGMLSRAGGQGGSRVSFSMAATLEKLKDSFRMGISKEEGATCLRLLASEVAPEWVRVITIGGRENVVVETDRQLSKADVEGRVQGLLGRE